MKQSIKRAAKRILLLGGLTVLMVSLLTGCGGSGNSGGSGGGQSSGEAGETARTIEVQETNGTVVVLDNDKNSTNAYKGMHLVSGNDVTVHEKSDLTMLLDMDKYLYAEENTHFWLEASGSQENSQTVIYMDEGAELNRIMNPLEKGEVYQVNTPNSTMAVRGTVFRVEVRKEKNNEVHADIAVLDGSVKIELKTTVGEFNGVVETFEAGQAATIRADEEISEFVEDENGEIATPIDYSEFSSGTLEKIIEYIDDGEEIAADKEELEEILEEVKQKEEEHNWNTVTVRQADCTHNGLEQSVCSICGQVENRRTTPVTEHKAAADWTTQKEPTCTETGLQTKSCTVCGQLMDNRSTPAKGHILTKTEGKAATCTETGNKAYWTCSECNKVYSDAAGLNETTVLKQTIPANGHSYGEATYTWTDDGKKCTAEKVCTVEGCTASVTETGEISSAVKTAATCTEKGTTTYTATFGDVNGFTTQTKDVVDIAAKGHAWGDWIKDDNDNHRRVCANDENHVETAAHSWDGGVITLNPTCTVKGVKTYTCSVCNGTKTEDVPASGHSYGDASYAWADNGKTCTAEKVCSKCGEDTEGHKITEVATITSLVKTPATCTTMGTTTYTATFGDVNGFTAQTKDVVDIRATGHSYAGASYAWAEDGKTCTAEKECSRCAADTEGHVVTEEATITSSLKTAATCTAMGTTTYTATFTKEGFATQTQDVQDIPMIAHSYGTPAYNWATDGKTCTAEKACTASGCSHKITEAATITSSVKTAATCTVKGTTTYTAAFGDVNGFTTQTKDVQDIPMIEHSYGEASYTWADDGKTCTAEKACIASGCTNKITEAATITSSVKTEATCISKGTTTYTAAFGDVNGFTTQTKDVEDIAARGHDFSEEWTVDKAATCTEAGSKSHHCSRCDEKSEVTVIAANGHSYLDDWTTVEEPTPCVKDGVKVRTCQKCSYIQQDKISCHTLGHFPRKEPTCVDDGYWEHWKCSKCGEYFLDSNGQQKTTWDKLERKALNPSGHNTAKNTWVKTEVTTEAGETKKTECLICDICGAVVQTKYYSWKVIEKIWELIETIIHWSPSS